MYLRNVYLRFYKSFNFDYLRKYEKQLHAEHAWEELDGQWYPFVRIPIDEKITTVVGANESGKTHLLTAIEKGLSGQGLERGDFCRSSKFFTVEQDKMRWPDFGFEWAGLTSEEEQALGTICDNLNCSLDRFLLFRTSLSTLTVYTRLEQGYAAHKVLDQQKLISLLPKVLRLQENIALPESVPIRFLAGDKAASTGLEALPRPQRVGFFDSIWNHLAWFQTKESVTTSADQIVREMAKFSAAVPDTVAARRRFSELDLARDLIRKIASIDPQALAELDKALREGQDAFANSLIDEINDRLKAKLNFPNWWVQDRDFRLIVSPRDYDLVFTIRDRTEREYAFTERSSGLRYFLSYYIQYLAHDRAHNQRELLLMDEPDAFLSSQGQQDLLKIFDGFANPADGSTPIQVIYVTHSPFLIDKNHGDRIRVLEKGVGEEGTRVVRDVSRNHYEPLRSAFGSFVGETTFIGNCNLMVEGLSDQILLAGAAVRLRSRHAPELENLDLNRITIVPAGGAPHIPYLVYLARGRDVEKPAVIVLLDSDSAGSDAKKDLLRGGPRGRMLLSPEYIFQIGELSPLAGAPVDRRLIVTEDLVPVDICARAAQRYLNDISIADTQAIQGVTAAAIDAEISQGKGIFDALEALLSKGGGIHIDKVGFARSVIETVAELSKDSDEREADALRIFDANMRGLFRQLGRMQRAAERELTSERVSARVDRAKSSFLQDHPTGARREEAFILFEEILSALDSSREADEITQVLQSLRRDFKVDDDQIEPIENYDLFCERLEGMRYAGRLATQEPGR